MRVIAGSARRLLLKAPDGMDTRPTADRVKESLFNMLNPDLFSGSGAIGIEALSRGAQRAVLVDASMECAGIIKQNLEVTKLGENAEIINEDVYAAIERLGRRGDKFDIIFMDPPYAAGYYVPVMEAIKKADILAAEGYIVAESAKGVDFTAAEGFKIFKERKCGPAVMNFLNLEEEKC